MNNLKIAQVFSFILIFLMFSVQTQAQKHASHGGKLPWVNGQMPNINTQNSFLKVSVSAFTLEEARKEAKKEFIQKLASQNGVIINNESTLTNNYLKNKKGVNASQGFTETTHIKSGDFEAVFSNIDEYYEYKNDTYHLWVLYMVAKNGQKLQNVPNLSYKVDNGAWRSLLVPGWAQFYTKQSGKGTVFLVSEAALIGGGFYLYNRYTYNNTRAQEAGSVTLTQEYLKRAKNYRTYSYITFGAAAGVYIYNVVDAFSSKKGKMTYDYKNTKLTIVPAVNLTDDYYTTVGINIQF